MQALYATSRTQHCMTLSTTEVEYVALAEGAKEGIFVRSVAMFFIQQNFHETQRVRNHFDERQQGCQGNGGEPLRSGRSKLVGARWYFIRELVGKKELKVVHVASEWQHVKLFKRHRKALLNLPAEE